MGYRLDESERLAFRYRHGGITIEDRWTTDQQGRYVWRTGDFSAEEPLTGDESWVRAAHGHQIREVQDGIFAVDNYRYYIEIPGNSLVRTTSTGAELLIPVDFEGGNARVTYAIVW